MKKISSLGIEAASTGTAASRRGTCFPRVSDALQGSKGANLFRTLVLASLGMIRQAVEVVSGLTALDEWN